MRPGGCRCPAGGAGPPRRRRRSRGASGSSSCPARRLERGRGARSPGPARWAEPVPTEVTHCSRQRRRPLARSLTPSLAPAAGGRCLPKAAPSAPQPRPFPSRPRLPRDPGLAPFPRPLTVSPFPPRLRWGVGAPSGAVGTRHGRRVRERRGERDEGLRAAAAPGQGEAAPRGRRGGGPAARSLRLERGSPKVSAGARGGSWSRASSAGSRCANCHFPTSVLKH